MPRVEFTSFALALAALGCAGNQGDGRNDSASAGGAAGSTATGGSGGPSGSGGAIPSAGSGGLASSSGGGGASAGSGNGGSAALGGTSSGGKGGALGAGAGPAIIFDTDMGPDIDDAGALAVLHALADNGEAKLLAVMISTSGDNGTKAIGFIDAVNTYYGRPDTPIGLWKGGTFWGAESYTSEVYADPATFPRDLDDSKDSVPDATDLYRQVLAGEPDGSVTIVCAGMMNNLKKLLESGADGNSSLSGTELVAQKVALLSQMGGSYPSGLEFNFYQQPAGGTTQAAVSGWPTPIIFSGWEIGDPILTGSSLANVPADNPVRAAYTAYFHGATGSSRSSWDLTSALVGVRGVGVLWDLESEGYNLVEADGSNAWQASPDGQHSYLKKRAENSVVADLLNALMAKPPGTPE